MIRPARCLRTVEPRRIQTLFAKLVTGVFLSTLLIAPSWGESESRKIRAEKIWEMPGRISIYDLQFGPATLEKGKWTFLGNIRSFNAGLYGDRLTLMVRFSYNSSRADVPLKFVIRLPDSRQYEKTVRLTKSRGEYSYRFTIHHPEEFLGSGSIYLYYGFSIVDVLDFTIVPGA